MRAKALLLLPLLAVAPSACVTIAYQPPTYTLVTIPAVGAPVYTASGTPGTMATPVMTAQSGSAMVAVPVVAAPTATPAPTPLTPTAPTAPNMVANPASMPLYAAPAAAPVIVTPVAGTAGILAPPVYYVR
jgi:hypothetical protein